MTHVPMLRTDEFSLPWQELLPHLSHAIFWPDFWKVPRPGQVLTRQRWQGAHTDIIGFSEQGSALRLRHVCVLRFLGLLALHCLCPRLEPQTQLGTATYHLHSF